MRPKCWLCRVYFNMCGSVGCVVCSVHETTCGDCNEALGSLDFV